MARRSENDRCRLLAQSGHHDSGERCVFNRSLAFLVAIERYENGIPSLNTPVADATALFSSDRMASNR
jgi:hypothetical protein